MLCEEWQTKQQEKGSKYAGRSLKILVEEICNKRMAFGTRGFSKRPSNATTKHVWQEVVQELVARSYTQEQGAMQEEVQLP